jgi:hypothetical protein
MAGLRIITSGDAVPATERFALNIGPALGRSILKGALLLGRKVAENVEAFKETVGTRRLARSFLVPEVGPGGHTILGGQSPIYAAIHEYGGTIHPKHADYLVFQTADGAWHSVKEVNIREKRYARDALEEFEREESMPSILAFELAQEFRA